MAYPQRIYDEAQDLYNAGYSAARIAREMKRRHPNECGTLAEKTVLEWVGRFAWEKAKAQMLAEAQAQRRTETVNRFGQINEILDSVIDTLTQRFAAAARRADATSPEYTAYALFQAIGLRGKQLALAASAAGDIGNPEQIGLFFECLAGDPQLGPVFEKRRAYVLAAYRQRLAERGVAVEAE